MEFLTPRFYSNMWTAMSGEREVRKEFLWRMLGTGLPFLIAGLLLWSSSYIKTSKYLPGYLLIVAIVIGFGCYHLVHAFAAIQPIVKKVRQEINYIKLAKSEHSRGRARWSKRHGSQTDDSISLSSVDVVPDFEETQGPPPYEEPVAGPSSEAVIQRSRSSDQHDVLETEL